MGVLMQQRFFRADPATYSAVLEALNLAWGLPANGQQTVFAPVDSAPLAGGMVYLAVLEQFCQYDAVAAMLPGLLASGVVEEIDEATYRAASEAPDAA